MRDEVAQREAGALAGNCSIRRLTRLQISGDCRHGLGYAHRSTDMSLRGCI
jgi:hypothetical protein